MSEQKIEIGDLASCNVTGIKGIVVVRHDYLYGCARLGIQPSGEAEGKAKSVHHIDIYQASLEQKGAVSRNGLIPTPTVELGDEIEDTISGFKGVCTGMAEWLYACTTVCITPRTLSPKTGKPGDCAWFDEQQVKRIEHPKTKEIKAEPETKRTGGFDKPQSDGSFNYSC